MNVAVGSKKRLGEILLEKELVSKDQINEAIQLQSQFGKRMGQIMIEKGWISEQNMLVVLSEQFLIPYVRLRSGIYDQAAVSLIDKETARKLEMLPLIKIRGILYVATADPQAIPRFDEIENRTGLKVKPVLACLSDICKNIDEAYSNTVFEEEYIGDLEEDFELIESQLSDDFTSIDEMAGASPVINLVNTMIQRAVHDGASDIHLEPSRTKCRVRFRIDGVLYEVMTPKIEMHAAIVSRLKVMAKLDIAERRLPQDGRIQVSTQGRVVDLRFSSLPGIFGEKVVLRVLDKNQSILDIHKLGMTEANLKILKKILKRSHGLILATGPTGSGKSTTLYAAINHLKSLEKNIVTIEDPVEYQIDLINQNQVKESIGLNFSVFLKHILRQDPDIIMVGEIREKETADIAVQAALTGHLVLSTLHTNDSVGAVIRLLEMGVEPYLLSSALIGIIAQRLVRTICPECKTTYLPGKEIREKLGLNGSENVRLAKGRGCKICYDSGYKNRIGLHEILVFDEGLQQLLNSEPSRGKLETYIRDRNSKSLLEDGYDRVIKGLTTIEEIFRAVNIG